MIKDPFEGQSREVLKATIAAERIMKEIGYHTSIKFSDETGVEFLRKKHTQWYGNFQYTYYSHTMNLTVKPDWYKKVYLNGVASCNYLGNLTVILDAKESDFQLKPEFDDLGFKVFKVIVPVRHTRTEPYVISAGSHQVISERTYYDYIGEERYMVTTPISNGTEAKCFAAKHPNAAAKNLKKWLTARMDEAMGL